MSVTKGFKKVAAAGTNYTYDSNGNLTLDNHNGMTFGYNYLNLPNTSIVDGLAAITWTYTADGEKLTKVSPAGTRNYVSGIEYLGANTEAIYHGEGRCTPNGASAFYYDYTIKDHLGNARVNFRANGAVVTYLEDFHYYPFGMQMEGIGSISGTGNDYRYNGKELNEDAGLNWYDYGARWYDPAVGRWGGVDPLVEEKSWLSPYNYVQNNPIIRIDPDGMLDDIVITGANNSTITVKTDLIDISVNASSIVGDLGGNYTLQGNDVLIAALDIVGIVDPTGVADVAAAGLEARQGNWGSAILSGMGVFPLIGDLGKLGKVEKHVKTIGNAIATAKAVNGNSKASTKAQNVYEIFETGTDNVVKTGISGGKVSQADKSYRATGQVNKMNKANGSGAYDSQIVEKIPSGPGARQKALDAEKINSAKHRSTLNPNYHKRP